MNRFSRVMSAPSTAVVRRMMSSNHEPPKKVFGHTGRYAMATFTAASKAGVLEKVEGELLAFRDVVKKSPGLAAFLANPTIPRPEKTSKISELFDEKKFTHITRNLFLTLSANGRVGEVTKVINSYADLMQASRGAVDVTIISAEALKKKQVETIQQAVMKFVGDSKSVDVKLHVDPSILGGLQVMVGDKFLDLSVNSRIGELTKTLDSAI